jgi:hypothetical protein
MCLRCAKRKVAQLHDHRKRGIKANPKKLKLSGGCSHLAPDWPR